MNREPRRAGGGDSGEAALAEIRRLWASRGIGGDGESFLAAASVLRVQRLMTQAIENELRPLRLNLTDYLVLMTLELNDRGTRMISQLARALVVRATTATMAADRLEGRGLLVRTPHPTDRRATEVRITDEGRDLVHRATEVLVAVDFGLSGSSPADRADLVDLLTRLRGAAGDEIPGTG